MRYPKEQLPDKLLNEYINTFYGYGHWDADYWFIGIEEGGGDKFINVLNRLKSWEKLEKTCLLDCYDHHCNIKSFTEENLKRLHSQTWTRLIITFLIANGRKSDYENIVEVQKNEWGRIKSNTLLIELLPLASPTRGKWFYKSRRWVNLNSDLSFLENRKSYQDHVLPFRTVFIREKLLGHTPKLVVFYGSTMSEYAKKIVDVPEWSNSDSNFKKKFTYCKLKSTLIILCPQPSYIRGYDFWQRLGLFVRNEIGIAI